MTMQKTVSSSFNGKPAELIKGQSDAALITILIEPASGWSALNLREIWTYRDLLYFLTWRDIKTRYSQTALGPLWIFIQPLFSMVLYTLVFGVVAKLPTGGIPYPIFSYAGLLPWGFFGDAVSGSLTSLLTNRDLIGKIYFPRLTLVLSRILSSLLDLAIAMLVLFGMMFYSQLAPNWTLVFVPLYLMIAALTGMGIGLCFSGIVVKYRDVGNLIGYFMRALMFASPVVYSIELIPQEWRMVYELNPMTNVILGFRYALLSAGPAPQWLTLGISTVLAVGLFLVGLFIFKRVERNIVDIA